MTRALVRLACVLAVSAVGLVLPASPSSATVHEIVAQWCSGHDHLEPPGISGGSNADNFARPLRANGFDRGVVPFDPDGAGPRSPGLLVDFDFGHPAAKVVGTGVYIEVGTTPAGPVYLQLVAPDPNFPAFRSCPKLAG